MAIVIYLKQSLTPINSPDGGHNPYTTNFTANKNMLTFFILFYLFLFFFTFLFVILRDNCWFDQWKIHALTYTHNKSSLSTLRFYELLRV